MEYYVLVTHRCNMACTYCSAGNAVTTNPSAKTLSPDQVLSIAEYIKEDLIARGKDAEENRIVFFGGEPLLAIDAMRNLFQATLGLPASYCLYTNGLALNKIPLDILSALKFIFVSFDGDKHAHEQHRGAHTYDRIVNNLIEIKKKASLPLIGRLTVEESTNLFESVTTMLELCDHVYWQIVNKPRFENPRRFIQNYESGIEQLFFFWLNQLRQGKILKLIPFESIANSLLNGSDTDPVSFRCACGTEFQAIDLDGTVYGCDEYVGTPLARLGNIKDGTPLSLNYRSHQDLNPDCGTCKNSLICLGRCRKMLQSFAKDQIQIYCRLTNFLIDLISANLPKIEKALQDNGLQEIYISPPITEEIP
ncbi:MAG: radical SAM protein [Thermodesulfobacteriota bacterium]